MLFVFQGSELNWKTTMALESRHPPLPSFLLFSPSLSFKMIFFKEAVLFFFRTLVVLVVDLNINSLLMLIILLMLRLLGVKLFAATH